MAVAVAEAGAGLETVLEIVFEIAESHGGRARHLQFIMKRRAGYRKVEASAREESGVKG
jgi:hypothetical protein